MLRGNYTARVDPKGRLKIPTTFHRLIEKRGMEVFVTSLTGENARIYPLHEWESIEQRLALLPSMDPARRNFIARTSYFGQQTTMDRQGRILIPKVLRKVAGVVSDVVVLGQINYLEVWESELFQQRLLAFPYGEEEELRLARLGI